MSVSKVLIYIFTLTPLLFSLSDALAQKNKKDLEKEKQENLRKIKSAEKILEETESEKVVSLGQLKALNQQIKARQELIGSISAEITYLTDEIDEITIVIGALENDFEELKKEYASMMYSAYKTRNGVNRLTFLFSASTFNQFLIRLQYLEQYAAMRKTQVEQIDKVRIALTVQKEVGEVKRKEQKGLLREQITENKKLQNSKRKQTGLITELRKKQDQLTKELNSRKQAIKNLDNLIADLIKKEMGKTVSVTIGAELSALFEQNRTKLPWPVITGFISSAYGRHPHPVLKGIVVENQGIDIQTQTGESVKAVFNGEVVTRAFVPGMNNVVIIKHGEFYTLYAKLKNVNVSKGQKVSVSESIGEVFTDSDGISELQFQVWRNQQKMDPAKWLGSN